MLNELLVIHLDTQVPFYIWEFHAKGGPTDEDFMQAPDVALLIAGKGDNILYRSKKKGETAKLVSKLAWGIALLSFCPGGAKVFGRHWDAEKFKGDKPVL